MMIGCPSRRGPYRPMGRLAATGLNYFVIKHISRPAPLPLHAWPQRGGIHLGLRTERVKEKRARAEEKLSYRAGEIERATLRHDSIPTSNIRPFIFITPPAVYPHFFLKYISHSTVIISVLGGGYERLWCRE